MGKSLKIFLKQLNLVDTVFYKGEGKVDNCFTSEVQKKMDIIGPNAYYVFNKQPLILFFDLTIEKNQIREKQIHEQVWSFDNAPIIFVIKSDEIKVYNALSFSKTDERLEEIKLTAEEIKSKFSFWELQSGFTWKWLQNEYYETRSKKQHRRRVNEQLFENIKEVREYLTNVNSENPLCEKEANSLILRLIFVRYLIDRKVKIDEKLISGTAEDVNARRKSFIKLIKQPASLNSLFIKLNKKFNGVLFKELDFILTQAQSNYLSDVFKGELQNEEILFGGFFFEIFDFSIIPVEVISGIYESLIDEETRKLDAAVYTPPFLVEYVLNDTVDKYLEEENTSECKIFEVAVGSGIFLVQSLRKMIDKELVINPNQTPECFSERIREIAKNNLFGIDINEEALKVACFSIYIAMLDYQDPKDIDIYEFPNLLNENLFEADFFNTSHIFNSVIKQGKPKFILGNPPWKKDKSKKHLEWVNTTKTYSKKIIDKLEIAQSFLLRTKDFMDAETKSALIVTSTLFYNISSTTKEFKGDFLRTFNIQKFFDLSPVRRLIFEKKNSPASIVYFKLSKGDSLTNIVNHQSLKSNHFLKHFKILVIEKYDQKKILQKHFIENDWMFKVALYGNTLDFNLIKKVFKNNNKIQDLIDNKTVFKGKGFFRGTPKRHFPFLEGMRYINNDQVKPFYTKVDAYNVFNYEDTYLESGRKIELYEGEHIYLKVHALNESIIVVSYCEETVVNRHDIITISSKKKTKLLKEIYSILISNLYTYYQYLTSASWGIGTRPAIRLEEQLSFPFIEQSEEIKNELILLVNQILKSFKEYYKEEIRSESLPTNYDVLSRINIIINNMYNVNDYEKDLINYALDVSRYQFQESKQHLVSDFTHIDETHYRNRNFVINEYASVFIREFEKIYREEHIQIEVYLLDYFIALNFVFSLEKPKKSVVYPKDKKSEEEILKRLANNLSISQITNTTDPTKNLFIQKDIKGFEDNSFYIIKPNEYKCWHKAIAWYDVAEFKEAIENAELKSLNEQVNEF